MAHNSSPLRRAGSVAGPASRLELLLSHRSGGQYAENLQQCRFSVDIDPTGNLPSACFVAVATKLRSALLALKVPHGESSQA